MIEGNHGAQRTHPPVDSTARRGVRRVWRRLVEDPDDRGLREWSEAMRVLRRITTHVRVEHPEKALCRSAFARYVR